MPMPPRWLGALLLAALAAHAAAKAEAGLPLVEMLWACHLASAILAVGLLLRARRAVTLGFLFHLAIGMPAFLLDILHNRTTTPTSVLVHVLPLAFGWLVVRWSGLPWSMVPAAWALWIAAQVVTYFAGDPALNVNLVHAPWGPLGGVLPGIWAARIVNALVAVAFLSTATFAYRRLGARAMLAPR